MKLLIVGSLAYDTISTEKDKINDTLGGSAVYAGISASWHLNVNLGIKNQVGLVGVIGKDFLSSDLEKLYKKGLNISGIKKEEGKTFRWSGSYSGKMEQAITHSTELNVFETFSPKVSEQNKTPEIVFCANMHPLIQLSVINQTNPKKFIAVDSMNLWINNNFDELSDILCRVEMAILNSDEVKMIANCDNLIQAGKLICSGVALSSKNLIRKGPQILIIKKGGDGCLAMTSDDFIQLPAYQSSKIIDPTGCGDSFAGALLAHLSMNKSDVPTQEELRKALIHANVTASFTIEKMGTGGIENLNSKIYTKRLMEYQNQINNV